MRKTSLLFAALLCTISVMAQKQHRSFSVSFTRFEAASDFDHVPLNNIKPIPTPFSTEGALTIDANLLQLTNTATLGFYVGSSITSYYDPHYQATTTSSESALSLRFGLHPQLHILPMMGVNSNYWDVTLAGTLGTTWNYGAEPMAECGAGIGAAFYPIKNIGLFTELLWGKYLFGDYETSELFKSQHMLKIGLSYRLGADKKQ